jgi:hypothetical protein
VKAVGLGMHWQLSCIEIDKALSSETRQRTKKNGSPVTMTELLTKLFQSFFRIKLMLTELSCFSWYDAKLPAALLNHFRYFSGVTHFDLHTLTSYT